MKYVVTINDKTYEVEVEKGQANIIRTTQATPVPVQAITPLTTSAVEIPASTPSAPAVVASGEPLKAPMPGNIVAVHVQAGTVVKKGDVLFILEAMKMESEITAARDGVVSQIMVEKGAPVSTGDILLMLH